MLPDVKQNSSGDQIASMNFFYDNIVHVHFYAMRPGSYWIRWNNAK